MTDVRTEARRKVKQEDIAGIEERIAQAAEQMAEDVRAARQRDVAAKLRVKQIAACEETKQSILEACGGAMIAVRTTVAKLREVFVLYATLRTQTTDLRGHIPTGWSPFEIISCYGFRLAAELSKVAGIANALGSVKWSLHGAYPAGSDWVADEKKILAMKENSDANSA